jgi:hypothetical protein
VSFPRAGDRDWVVLGARRDGVVIRAKRGSGVLTVPTASGAAPVVEAAPVRVSWSGGAPEQDHVDATTWWAVPGGAAWQVGARLDGPATVDLVVGTSGAPLTVTATLPGGGTSTVTLPASGTAASLVSVRTDGSSGQLSITLRADGGRLGLAAVALR